jgi:hypothetical protein
MVFALTNVRFLSQTVSGPVPRAREKRPPAPLQGTDGVLRDGSKKGVFARFRLRKGACIALFSRGLAGTIYSKFPLISDFVSRPPAISRSSS